MLALKSEATEDLTSLTESGPGAQQELSNWEHLVFAFDMDREKAPRSRSAQKSRSTAATTDSPQQRHRINTTSGVSEYDISAVHTSARASTLSDVQDATLLAQFAAAAGGTDVEQAYANMLATQNTYQSMGPASGFYGNFLHHNPMPPPQLPPLSSLDFHWNQSYAPDQQPLPSHHFDQLNAGPSTGIGMNPFLHLQTPLPHSQPQPQSHTQFSAPSSPDLLRSTNRRPSSTRTQSTDMSPPTLTPGGAEQGDDMHGMTDEKRRRNTAASARFRVKKKHKTLSLERTVTELAGRAEDLEREAGDLRRENGWLKEIVMLKGTRFAATNMAHRQALSQAAVLALSGPPPVHRASGPAIPEEQDEYGESESDEDDQDATKRKGKSKQ